MPVTPLHAHADVFLAIAHPTRRAILDRLRRGEQPVLALAQPFDMTLPAVSQQLRVLRRADLVRERREGRQRYYRLNPEPLREVRDWMRMYDKFWTGKLRKLGDYLDRHRD
jgi:DNA-binding transcriptional ArsR family regulator